MDRLSLESDSDLFENYQREERFTTTNGSVIALKSPVSREPTIFEIEVHDEHLMAALKVLGYNRFYVPSHLVEKETAQRACILLERLGDPIFVQGLLDIAIEKRDLNGKISNLQEQVLEVNKRVKSLLES